MSVQMNVKTQKEATSVTVHLGSDYKVTDIDAKVQLFISYKLNTKY